jgi:hypothetical protein
MTLSPEPQTWQESARSRGWWVAPDGTYALRGTKNQTAIMLLEYCPFSFKVKELDNDTDWWKYDEAELAFTRADMIADRCEGWA